MCLQKKISTQKVVGQSRQLLCHLIQHGIPEARFFAAGGPCVRRVLLLKPLKSTWPRQNSVLVLDLVDDMCYRSS